ncbi:MAG: DUF4864 domain-containing protein [Actinomycetota bacterium]
MRQVRVLQTAIIAGALVVGGGLASARLQAAPSAALLVFQEKDQPAPPKLRNLTEAERKQVTGAIEAQLKAFRADDFKTAEKYQHSSLKENFGSTDAFRAMMRRGYPQVVNYKTVAFGDSRCDEPGQTVQIRVTITGKDSSVLKMVYVMEKEEGEYRVLSVFGGQPPKAEPRDVA